MFIYFGFCLIYLAGCAPKSIGPVDSPNYLDNLSTSIQEPASAILYNKQCTWFVEYSANIKYKGGINYVANPGISPAGILTVTDSRTMFLVWSQKKNKYGYLFDLHISEIQSVNIYDEGLTLAILTKNNKLYLLQVLVSGRSKIDEHKRIQGILLKKIV